MDIPAYHAAQGAQVAADGIPLIYRDVESEYDAAIKAAVLLDRSHEGRLNLSGNDRVELLQRMSTNDLHNMAASEGRPTIFTNANARVLERVLVYNRESLLLVAGPGRSEPLRNYQQRNIFFRDDVRIEMLDQTTKQFSLHGPRADAIAEALAPGAASLPDLQGIETTIADVPAFLARRKPYSGAHWLIVTPAGGAVAVWAAIVAMGTDHGLLPAGSLTYNTLRIRAGRPAMGRELSTDFIPLEVGVWDEVSFSKGCYTGQEIIARMESRQRLAKTIVRLKLSEMVDAPADLLHKDKRAGTLTSSVRAPDGSLFAIGVVKTALAVPETTFSVGSATATVIELAGVQPLAAQTAAQTAAQEGDE